MNVYDTLVIGGGYTGMVAALDLAKRGQKVLLLEKSHSLGGLAGGFQIEGASLEKAYHHLFHTDHEILKLVDDLGLQSRLQWLPSSVAIRHGGRSHPFMGPLDLLRFRALSPSARLRLGWTLLRLKRMKDGLSLADETAWTWMRRSCGDEACRVVWEPLLRGKFSQFAEQVSMAWLWARIHIRANSRQPGASGERLGYFEGGFAVFTEALHEALKNVGVEVRLGVPVTSLKEDPSGIAVSTDSGVRVGRKVIFTGSNRALAKLLPAGAAALDTYRDRLLSIPYLGAACLVFSTPQELGDHYWTNVNEPGAPFLVFIRHTKLYPSTHYNGREVYYLGAYLPQESAEFQMDETALRKAWFDALQRLYPDFDQTRVRESHLFRFTDAQHVVTPGYSGRMPSHETPLPGLYLANFSQIFPEDRGTNYAVREGHRIAELVAGVKRQG